LVSLIELVSMLPLGLSIWKEGDGDGRRESGDYLGGDALSGSALQN
jgi:hypothetical protein